MASVTRWIDYQDLPAAAGGFSSLFLDYLRDGGAAERYFPATFRSGGGFESVMAAIGAHAPDRTTLTQVLNEQNTAFGAGQRTIENIAMLARPETFAVVTGQQVGLLGGPLYTVFKTITTIKLAAKLKEKVVPEAPRSPPAIPIRGINSDLPVKFAPNGGAVPGDRIVGIVTPGEGITIYPIQSPALKDFEEEPERWLDVRWDIEDSAPQRFPAVPWT